jgi:carboxymethylenebutenolidase
MRNFVAALFYMSLVSVLIFSAFALERPALTPSAMTVHWSAVRSAMPLPGEAKALLNSSHHHGEWIRVPAGRGTILAAVNYPDRADAASVVVITANDQRLSPWLRAVADQVTSEGFITVVPDTFANAAADIEAVRQYVIRHPASNGKSVSLTLSSTIEINVAVHDARFELSKQSWPAAMAFLNRYSENDLSKVVLIPAGVHEGHQLLEAALQTQGQRGNGGGQTGDGRGGPRGYPGGKLDNLPAGLFTAKGTLLRSSIKADWAGIPTPGIYTGHIRTRITYPQGNGKAGIVVVMQHGPGSDEWMQSVGDQLSREGFIALVPDLHTGMGPRGGGYESFDGPDGAFAANANLRPAMTIAAYKTVRDYGMKLARANGKSAALGFCMGGGNAWVLATEVPELSAAVVYYGVAPDDGSALAKIKAPVIGFYGEDDARITATVEGVSATMKKLRRSYDPHVYPHATHGFLEFQDLGGNAPATLDSWTRTIAFLKQYLQ